MRLIFRLSFLFIIFLLIFNPITFPQGLNDNYYNAENMIVEICEKKWPRKFSMRVYCEKQQRKGLNFLKGDPPSNLPYDVFRTIRLQCEEKWPKNFNMRVYCEKGQFNAFVLLNRGKPADIDFSKFEIVRETCENQWQSNYKMRAYCEKKEFNAIRELQNR